MTETKFSQDLAQLVIDFSEKRHSESTILVNTLIVINTNSRKLPQIILL